MQPHPVKGRAVHGLLHLVVHGQCKGKVEIRSGNGYMAISVDRQGRAQQESETSTEFESAVVNKIFGISIRNDIKMIHFESIDDGLLISCAMTTIQ